MGVIVDGQMQLNDAGRMVQAVWDQLPDRYPGVDVDAFVVMPNHVHGIIILTGDPGDMVGATPHGNLVGATPCGCPNGQAQGPGQARGPAPNGDSTGGLSLPDVVHRFKSFTTTQYRWGVKDHGWPPFPGRLWQRNYYEHIIRTAESLERIRAYIQTNPERWVLDREDPARTGQDEFESWIDSSLPCKEAPQ